MDAVAVPAPQPTIARVSICTFVLVRQVNFGIYCIYLLAPGTSDHPSTADSSDTASTETRTYVAVVKLSCSSKLLAAVSPPNPAANSAVKSRSSSSSGTAGCRGFRGAASVSVELEEEKLARRSEEPPYLPDMTSSRAAASACPLSQYLYFCTRKASKLRAAVHAGHNFRRRVSICTFVLVKQVNSAPPYRPDDI